MYLLLIIKDVKFQDTAAKKKKKIKNKKSHNLTYCSRKQQTNDIQ